MSTVELGAEAGAEARCEMSELQCAVAAERLRTACGIGATLVLGDAPDRLLNDLRTSCMRVVSPGGDSLYENILIVLQAIEPDDTWLDVHWRQITTAAGSVAVLLCGQGIDPSLRVAWEAALIGRGLRKHPRLEFVAPYNELDLRSDIMMLLFEPVPPVALQAYPLHALREERDLHMDMMREAGRRSDAHLTRYAHAANFVRPRDRILDAACGLGYGSHVLMSQALVESLVGLDASEYAVRYATMNFASGEDWIRYQQGDAEDLSFIADESIDFAVSVETLEHLYRPERLLAELMRVLTPGGRAYLSVPYNWADETGHDPNPFHHHVYHWPTLAEQVQSQGFLIERAWTQDAGGGQRLPHAARAVHEFDPTAGPTRDGEWLLALVVKPLHPASGKRFDARDRSPNILAFERDYVNPWLVRGLVSIGLRIESPAARAEVARTTLAESPPGSADQGAALCVLCYHALDNRSADAMAIMAQQAEAWQPADASNPTQLRWRTSLLYAGALLRLALGQPEPAARLFGRVSSLDALEYSPLLGTKTVGAAVRAGLLALSARDEQAAKQLFSSAIEEAMRLVESGHRSEIIGGDPVHPTTFGLPELGQVLAEAAKAAFALQGMRAKRGRPGQTWQLMRHASGGRDGALHFENLTLRKWIADLDTGRQWLETRIAEDAEYRSVEREGKTWLESQYGLLTAEVARLEADLRLRGEDLTALERDRRWLEGQYHAYVAELEAASMREAQLRVALESATEAKAWLDTQYHAYLGELEAASAREAQLRSALASTGESKAWLDEQYHSLTDALARAQAVNQQLADQMGEMARIHAQEREQALARISQLEATLPRQVLSTVRQVMRRTTK